MKNKLGLIFFFIVVLSSFVSADNIDACAVLNKNNTVYYLTADIIESGYIDTCLDITGNNVTLDCQGYLLDSELDYSAYGIAVTRAISENVNVTIRNCFLDDFEQANIYSNKVSGLNVLSCYASSSEFITNSHFYFTYTNDSYFYNLSASDFGTYGIDFEDSFNNIIENSKSENMALDGIFFLRSGNNTLRNSILQNNSGNGIVIFSSYLNHIYNNMFNNSNQSGFSGTLYNNSWNTTNQTGTRIYSDGTNISGNYWTNSSKDGYSDTCTDSDTDGFCDVAYNVSSGLAVSGTDFWGNVDYLPLSNKYSLIKYVPPTELTKICNYSIESFSSFLKLISVTIIVAVAAILILIIKNIETFNISSIDNLPQIAAIIIIACIILVLGASIIISMC